MTNAQSVQSPPPFTMAEMWQAWPDVRQLGDDMTQDELEKELASLSFEVL